MQYLALWEMKAKDMDVVVKKYQELIAEREKGSEKFPQNPVSDNYVFTGTYKGFIIYGEETTEEQLLNVSLHFGEIMSWKYKLISSSTKTMGMYLKSK